MAIISNDLFRQNPPEITEKRSCCTIGIAGCGGLGSNVAMLLIRAGITNLTLVDFDSVELNNLNRQFYFQKDIGKLKTAALKENLLQINPNATIRRIDERINENNLYELFSTCKLIVEAFDTVEAKTMIAQRFQGAEFADKYLIAASGLAGIKSANMIHTKRIANNIYICGDFFTESNRETGLLSSRVMVTAAHQANMVLRIVAGNFKP
ncbi:MAG: sulfur carrier protein ThiS adenylyltransferase ThiF [Fidelibacterota bacterium]